MRRIILFFSIIVITVSNASPLQAITTNDPLYREQTYLPFINIEKAWDYQTGSSDVVVAVIDTGVDIDHPDLFENIWVNQGEVRGDGIDNDNNGYIDDINGWDFIRNQADPKPKIDYQHTATGMEHGTLVAGIIGARGNNNYGIAGINWQVSIMSLVALNGDGSGNMSDVVKAINYATDNNADIINLSLVGSMSDTSLDQAIAHATASGVLVVAAVGNEKIGEHNIDNSVDLGVQPRYPVCSETSENTVLGVGAIDYLNSKSLFSNYGKCLDINAPGQLFFGLNLYYPVINEYREKFSGYWSGTSMATPVITGVAALLKATDESLTNKQIIKLITDQATNIDASNYRYAGKMGAGKINVDHLFDQLALTTNGQNQLLGSNRDGQEIFFYNQKLDLINSIKLDSKISTNYHYAPITKDAKIVLAIAHNGFVTLLAKTGEQVAQWSTNAPLINILSWNDKLVGYNNKDVFIYAIDGTELLSFTTSGIDDFQISDIDHDQIDDLLVLDRNKIYVYSQLGIMKNSISLVSSAPLNSFTINNDYLIATQVNKKESAVAAFNHQGQLQKTIAPYPKFTKKILVRSWRQQILVVPLEGGGPHLKIYDNNLKLIKEKFITDVKNSKGLTIYAH